MLDRSGAGCLIDEIQNLVELAEPQRSKDSVALAVRTARPDEEAWAYRNTKDLIGKRSALSKLQVAQTVVLAQQINDP